MSVYLFPPSPSLAGGELEYACCEQTFTEQELDRIVEIGQAQTLITAHTTDGPSDPRRKSKVAWLPHNDETDFIYNTIRNVAATANGQYFQFDLFGFVEDFQYTVYDEEGSHYSWHTDRGILTASPRKLSVVIQLSDPADYDGGDLEFGIQDPPIVARKARGMAYVFPSWVAHRVTPVTRGVRRTLVVWIAGPRFR
jgi:PKHD-type hydroxylase